MHNSIKIENIEEMRLCEGIDDVELRGRIRGLAVGDFVKLTFLTDSKSFETLLIRITGIQGCAFRGQLVQKPIAASLSKLSIGTPVEFTSAHIHSIVRGRSHGS